VALQGIKRRKQALAVVESVMSHLLLFVALLLRAKSGVSSHLQRGT
jgi:hypothetical protein